MIKMISLDTLVDKMKNYNDDKDKYNEYVIYQNGGVWGSHIRIVETFTKWAIKQSKDKDALMEVSGHKQRIPKIGDFLTMNLQSGRILTLRFVEVRPCSNPRDMFYGDVKYFTITNDDKPPDLTVLQRAKPENKLVFGLL